MTAHCGLSGNRGVNSTLETAERFATWPTVKADVKALIQGCLVCLFSESCVRVPRPLRSLLHTDDVGELLHFDYLYIGPSSSGMEYKMILKEDFSGYVFLRPCARADAETALEVLMEYLSTFVPVLQWVSDQGPFL